MRFDKKRAFYGLLIAGVAGGFLFLPAIYFIGLSLAPPPPARAAGHTPPMLAHALWARADGGSAAALTPVTTLTLARFAGCMAFQDWRDTSPGDAQRDRACRGQLPAIQGVEYLSRVHMRDANLEPSLREGVGRLATTIWVTRSWSKADFINALAERGEFGPFRGADAAARGYFDSDLDRLTVAQAALLGALIGVRDTDAWCDPAGAASLRHRILERMRENHAIDEHAFTTADVSDLALAPPPPNHPPCPS